MQIEASSPVWAPLLDEKTAKYGQGIILGEFMNLTHNYTYAEGSLYGDNRLVEHVKEPTGGDVTLGTTWLPFRAYEAMFGVVSPTANERITVGNPETRYGGLGFVSKGKREGKVFYTANWIYKTSFTAPNDAITTKSGNIQFNTPSMSGKSALLPNLKIDHKWDYKTFEEALNKVYSLANINDGTFVGQPYIFPDNGAAISATTPITIVSNTPDAEIRYTTDGTEPTTASTLYEAPINLNSSSTVKAIAVSGDNVSSISYKKFII
ncbi:MAG: chitobiase/beta-hexosaminidase C-terminal domain-containing protein [Clostridia bacterium]|nr:chitobiase/beta-hexosaminidase C-terminal domain-containing protein [Clostridia bacterium]